MRILICDDNPLILEQLNKYLVLYFQQHKLKLPEIVTYSSGDALLQDTGAKDIVFLDIEMPGVDGIYVGNKLKKFDSKTIIFVISSFAEYLDEAMRFHVFRYLSKPIEKQRLFRNLKDALHQYHTRNNLIAVETKSGVHAVLSSDIIFIEAQSRNVIIHTVSEDYYSIHNIDYWITQLKEPCFYQTHRSFIVNLTYVTDFDNSVIHLHNHQFTAYLTRRKYTEFKSNYLLYLESTR